MAEVKLRGLTMTVEQKLITETCCNCGILFAMTEDFKKDRLEKRPNDKSFYCPRGHPQHYLGEREEDKLRREVNSLRQNKAYLEDRRKEAEERAEHERRRANGYKGHATKITKRAKAGVCPCCNRTFQQLARHMATKHPTFTPIELEAEAATVQ